MLADNSDHAKKMRERFYGSAELQAEFGSLAIYCAYRRAEDAGRVRLVRSGTTAPPRAEFKPSLKTA